MSQKQLSEEAESRIIEAMARAMCNADGVDPDEAFTTSDHTGEIEWKVAWHCHFEACQRLYRASLAMGRQQQIECLSVPPVFDPNEGTLFQRPIEEDQKSDTASPVAQDQPDTKSATPLRATA